MAISIQQEFDFSIKISICNYNFMYACLGMDDGYWTTMTTSEEKINVLLVKWRWNASQFVMIIKLRRSCEDFNLLIAANYRDCFHRKFSRELLKNKRKKFTSMSATVRVMRFLSRELLTNFPFWIYSHWNRVTVKFDCRDWCFRL